MIWSDSKRYRVVDRWLSIDHHGHFEEAWHVFLEEVKLGAADDRPGRLAPAYFSREVIQRAFEGAVEELAEKYEREDAESAPRDE